MDEEGARPAAPAPLRFACSCASARDVADDPWTDISKQGKLKDGTKESILNAIHHRPRTIAQLAQDLALSQPAIHRHITDLLTSELIREVAGADVERRWTVERYYRPNFPVVLAEDRRQFEPILDVLAQAFAVAFREQHGMLADAFARTSLPSRGEELASLLHYLYTAAVRLAREQLESAGALPPWPEHRDGSRWLWWAEEADEPTKEGDGT